MPSNNVPKRISKNKVCIQLRHHWCIIKIEFHTQIQLIFVIFFFISRLIAEPLILKISHESEKILQSWYSQLKKIIDKSYGRMFKMNDIIQKDPSNFYNVNFYLYWEPLLHRRLVYIELPNWGCLTLLGRALLCQSPTIHTKCRLRYLIL